MKDRNRVTLLGRTGSEPDVRTVQDGARGAERVAYLPLATTRPGDPGRTDWHRLTFGGSLAELAADIRKGERLYVEGHIQYGSYERDGVQIPTTDINVTDYVRLEPEEVGA